MRIDYHHVNVLNNYSKQLYLVLSNPISPICSINTQQWKLQNYKSAPRLLSHYHTHCLASNHANSTISLVYKYEHSFAYSSTHKGELLTNVTSRSNV